MLESANPSAAVTGILASGGGALPMDYWPYPEIVTWPILAPVLGMLIGFERERWRSGVRRRMRE